MKLFHAVIVAVAVCFAGVTVDAVPPRNGPLNNDCRNNLNRGCEYPHRLGA